MGGCANQVFAVAGDLEQDNLGLSVADREVLRRASVIFHLGAHFAWGLSVEHSRAVNVEGAKRVALLAAEQKSRLVMIGGYMLKNHEHLHWPVTDFSVLVQAIRGARLPLSLRMVSKR